jgi:hypothetical protein
MPLSGRCACLLLFPDGPVASDVALPCDGVEGLCKRTDDWSVLCLPILLPYPHSPDSRVVPCFTLPSARSTAFTGLCPMCF